MIYNTDHEFDFNQIVLKTPASYNGGHFIKYTINDSPLYIKPPKCNIKLIAKSSNKKRMNCDLQFTRESEDFIQWIENLEIYTRKILFDNRAKWFDSELEENDIANSFVISLKPYKSGKIYIMRTAIPIKDESIDIKIYDEEENIVDIENIKENTEVMTIMECKGVKCSSRNFQIEFELKQMMVQESKNLFEKCILTNSIKTTANPPIKELKIKTIMKEENNENIEKTVESLGETPMPVIEPSSTCPSSTISISTEEDPPSIKNELCEVEFNLEEMPEMESVQLKKRNDVYYEMYREARRKAKVARDLALSAYLEAKRIKNTYMLDNLKDSDESDNEFDDDEDIEDEAEEDE
jgi:hypothetical protein